MFVKFELRSSLSYPDLAKEILSKFISEDEIPRSDLSNIVDKAVQRFLNKNEGTVNVCQQHVRLQTFFPREYKDFKGWRGQKHVLFA